MVIKWDQNGSIDIDTNMNKQIEDFSVFLNQNFLTKVVLEPNRGANILDLVLTNDPDSCLKTSVKYNKKFSDHNWICVNTNLKLDNSDSDLNNLDYITNIRRYN